MQTSPPLWRKDFIYPRISMNRIILFLFHKNKQNEIPEIKTGRLSATGKQINCYVYYLYV